LLAFACALPVAAAFAAAILTRLGDNRARYPAGQQTAKTRGPCRLQQSPPPRAGGGQLEEGIERFVVHTASPFGVHRPQIVIHRHASPQHLTAIAEQSPASNPVQASAA